MKAMQITTQGAPEVLQLTELPDPVPERGEILIDVQASAVNFSDIMRRRGTTYPFPTPLPFVPGGEVAGTVAALGDGVEGPPVGTPVFALVGADGSGGYAELAIASAQQVIPIPPGLDVDQAAGVVVAGATATLLLTQAVPLAVGQSVLIPGAAGGVGSYAVQIAKLLEAGTVIASASTQAKREVAMAFGADHAIDPTAVDWPAQVRAVTGGNGVDVALEMSGGETLAQTLSTLALFGRMVSYGMAGGVPGSLVEAATVPWLYDPAPNQSLHAFNLGLWFGLRPEAAVGALQQLIGWVASGAIRVPVGQTLPLADAALAHTLTEQRETTGKVILKP